MRLPWAPVTKSLGPCKLAPLLTEILPTPLILWARGDPQPPRPRGPCVCNLSTGLKFHIIIGNISLQDFTCNFGSPNPRKILNLWAAIPGQAPKTKFSTRFLLVFVPEMTHPPEISGLCKSEELFLFFFFRRDTQRAPRTAHLEKTYLRAGALDCCKMDEVAHPKFYRLDSWSNALSDSKTVFASALTPIKIHSFIIIFF